MKDIWVNQKHLYSKALETCKIINYTIELHPANILNGESEAEFVFLKKTGIQFLMICFL